jgi:phenylpropionate dioxygenase-like ring-hydroxylating dioxygenase large terminal subunit
MAGHHHEMHQIRLDLCRRMIEHAKSSTTDVAPGVMFNDVSVYTDSQRHELELQHLFHGMPQVVCLSSDLPDPGSYRLFDDTGVPIFVMRGKDGVVRAFLNICPHRGARLLRETEGRVNRITCRFHGWSFDVQGQKGIVTQEEHFLGAVDEHRHLIPCPAAERHGLVFVKTVPNSTMDIDAHLGTFAAELEKLDLDESRKVCDGELVVNCNWKYALDTYFENYHFAVLHKNSLAPLFPSTMSLYDTWGPHHRLVFPPREAWDWVNQPESQWKSDTISTPYFIFPNTIVYLGSLKPEQAYVTTFRMYPRGVGEMVTRMTTYAPHGVDSAEYRAEIESAFRALVQLVQDEDYSVTGESWHNFKFLPKGSRVVYGRQELAVQHAHQWIARSIGVADPEVVLGKNDYRQPKASI